MSFDHIFPSRKLVIGSSEQDLNNKVNEHLAKGWRTVGKKTVTHGVYKSEHIQVMEIGEYL